MSIPDETAQALNEPAPNAAISERTVLEALLACERAATAREVADELDADVTTEVVRTRLDGLAERAIIEAEPYQGCRYRADWAATDGGLVIEESPNPLDVALVRDPELTKAVGVGALLSSNLLVAAAVMMAPVLGTTATAPLIGAVMTWALGVVLVSGADLRRWVERKRSATDDARDAKMEQEHRDERAGKDAKEREH